MAKLVVLYKKPADKDAFDAYYVSKHVPIAKKIPGLRSYEFSSGPVASPRGESPFHLIALLGFDSLAAIQQGMSSPEGVAAAADLENFAQAGADLLIFDTKDI